MNILNNTLTKKITLIIIICSIFFFISCSLIDPNPSKKKFDEIYDSLYEGVDFEHLTLNIDVPSLVDGVSITYTSSNSSRLFYENNQLVINAHLSIEYNVTLFTTLSLDAESFTYRRGATIVPLDIDGVYSLIIAGFTSTNEAFPNITQNLEFPTSVRGFNVSYSSSNPAIVSNSGLVTPSTVDKNITLEVTISRLDFETTRNYQLKVLAVYDPFELGWSLLETGFHQSNPEYPLLTTNLSIITTINGITFTYTSSNSNSLSALGVVSRSSSDINLIFSVTATLQGTSQYRTYNLTVKALDATSEFTDYTPYQYQNGGGTGTSANPIKLLNNVQTQTGTNIGLPSPSTAPGSSVSLNALVVPIYFTNDTFTEAELELIRKGFLGTSEETGWESVKTYYEKSSFGKVSFDATILSPISIGKSTSQAISAYGEEMDYYCMNLLFTTYADLVNWPSLDTNNDSKIDGIYFIYSKAYSDMPWWAYMFEYFPSYGSYGNLSASGKTPGVYMWASVNFFKDNLGNSTNYKVNVNAETFTHESGHMFGLDDYYDYNSNDAYNNDGGLGGADMMDYNNGDHGPFNKIILGWITPMIVTNTIRVKIYKANTSGQVLLLPKSWNHSYFSEYLLIDYYTPDALYDVHLHTTFYNSYMFKIPGIRIYQIISTSSSSRVFINNNTDTRNKLIKYISAGTNNIASSGHVANSDLFQVNTTFDWSTRFHWSDNSSSFSNITVDEINGDYAIISITF